MWWQQDLERTGLPNTVFHWKISSISGWYCHHQRPFVGLQQLSFIKSINSQRHAISRCTHPCWSSGYDLVLSLRQPGFNSWSGIMCHMFYCRSTRLKGLHMKPADCVKSGIKTHHFSLQKLLMRFSYQSLFTVGAILVFSCHFFSFSVELL